MASAPTMILPSLKAVAPGDEDARFRQFLRAALVVAILFGVVMPLLPLPEQPEVDRQATPPRTARLLLDRPEPPPPPKPKPPVQPQREAPQPKAAPKPEPKPAKPDPRARVAKVGLLALRDELARLREAPVAEKITRSKPLIQGETKAKEKQRSVIAQRATQGSGGIDTARLSRDTGGGSLEAHKAAEVAPLPEAEDAARNDLRNGRTEEEIRLIFDEHKSFFEFLYVRELRRNPTLKGQVVFEFTIAPSGKVDACRIVSSELNAPDLERKFVTKCKSIDYGSKDVEPTLATYRVDFFK